MSRKLTAEQRQELDRLMRSSTITLDFLKRISALVPAAGEAARQGIERAYERGDLRALRMAERDFVEWSQALAPAQRDELETLLRVSAGHDRDDTRQELAVLVANALARGVIEGEDEYRAVLRRLDELEQKTDGREEARRLSALISTNS